MYAFVRLVALCALLVGCYSLKPETTRMGDDVVHESIAEYHAEGNDVSACEAEADRVRIIVAKTEAQFVNLCRLCPPGCTGRADCQWGCAAGCYIVQRDGSAISATEYPTVVVWHDYGRDAIVRHELRHWLNDCSGRYPWEH